MHIIYSLDLLFILIYFVFSCLAFSCLAFSCLTMPCQTYLYDPYLTLTCPVFPVSPYMYLDVPCLLLCYFDFDTLGDSSLPGAGRVGSLRVLGVVISNLSMGTDLDELISNCVSS